MENKFVYVFTKKIDLLFFICLGQQKKALLALMAHHCIQQMFIRDNLINGVVVVEYKTICANMLLLYMLICS